MSNFGTPSATVIKGREANTKNWSGVSIVILPTLGHLYFRPEQPIHAAPKGRVDPHHELSSIGSMPETAQSRSGRWIARASPSGDCDVIRSPCQVIDKSNHIHLGSPLLVSCRDPGLPHPRGTPLCYPFGARSHLFLNSRK
jgi:hypothetical protein